MSKKEDAFALFSQGKRPSDKEVKALGLSAKTRYNYYQEYKKSAQENSSDTDELAELKKELKQTQEYISELKAHYDTMIDKAYSLIKLEMGKTTKEMEEIWMSVEKDTTPGPKPPPPPLGAAREIR